MNPRFSFLDATHGCFADSEFNRKGSVAFARKSDFSYIFVNHLGVGVFFPEENGRCRYKSMHESVPAVFCSGHIFKIPRRVVSFDSALMIYTEALRSWTDKCLGYQVMEIASHCNTISPLGPAKTYDKISVVFKSWMKYLASSSSRSWSYSFDPRKIRDHVVRKLGNCFPDFFGGRIFGGHDQPPDRLILSRAARERVTPLRLN